jgi:hypothetical protein
VRGKLTYQGKPVVGATIDFLAPGASRSAVGTTDENGSFRLTTFEPDDGAVAGNHVVTVIKANSQPVDANPAQVENDPKAIEKAMIQSALQQRRAKSEVPAKYTDRKTSDLRVEVARRQNDVEIKLLD